VSRVEPVYPPEAKARGVKGNVVLEIRVDADGKVTDVKVLRSVDAALDQAAVDAVRQWRYAPLTPATPVIATVTVRFHLN
jgi:protein TonB